MFFITAEAGPAGNACSDNLPGVIVGIVDEILARLLSGWYALLAGA